MFRFIIILTGGEEKTLGDKWSFEFSAGFEFMLPTCKELIEPWGRAGVWLKTTSPRDSFPHKPTTAES